MASFESNLIHVCHGNARAGMVYTFRYYNARESSAKFTGASFLREWPYDYEINPCNLSTLSNSSHFDHNSMISFSLHYDVTMLIFLCFSCFSRW